MAAVMLLQKLAIANLQACDNESRSRSETIIPRPRTALKGAGYEKSRPAGGFCCVVYGFATAALPAHRGTKVEASSTRMRT